MGEYGDLQYFYEKRTLGIKQCFTFHLKSYMIYSLYYALVVRGKGEVPMTENRSLSFRKGDWIAIALVVVLALVVGLLFLPSNGETGEQVVQIYQNGELLRQLPLSGEETVTVGGKYENTLVIHNGTVSITHSTCPGEDCVHSGTVSKAGRSLVCLPNGVEIRITGSDEIDFVVG